MLTKNYVDISPTLGHLPDPSAKPQIRPPFGGEIMAKSSDVILLGRLSGIDNWSDPVIWLNQNDPPVGESTSIPTSSSGMNVEAYVSSTDDLGTAHKPFQTNDIIGVAQGLNHPPTLTVTGFLHTNEIQNLYRVSGSGGQTTVSGNVQNVGFLNAYEQGVVDVKGNLVGVPQVSASTGGTIELGGHAGNIQGSATVLEFGYGGGKIILDNPGGKAFQNLIDFNPGATLELGHMQFDAAKFVPKAPGVFDGSLQLTEHGKLVYTLNNMAEISTPGYGFSVGRDAATGNDAVMYKAT